MQDMKRKFSVSLTELVTYLLLKSTSTPKKSRATMYYVECFEFYQIFDKINYTESHLSHICQTFDRNLFVKN